VLTEIGLTVPAILGYVDPVGRGAAPL